MQNNWKGKHGPLLIAEIGGNHEGNFEYAKKLTQLAIDSGADYVKFQIYTGDGLVSKLESPDRNQHFKKFELNPEQHIELAEMCHNQKVGYTASVWNFDALEWINPYMDFFKVGSGDLTAYPMLRELAKYQKPILISTGLASEKEVVEAIDFLRQQNDFYKNEENIAVLQCTSMYPINNSDANLNVMHRFKELLNCAVGYSDHTEGNYAMEIAVAMGAEVLEFHFTDDRTGKTFRDHKVSLTKDEVQELIQKIKLINTLKGASEKKALPIEINNGHDKSFRRAVYPLKDIKKGEILSEKDLTVLRPFHGIDAREYDQLIGKKALQDLEKYQKLSWDYFE
ncbi:N-acetylneuraminate synthase family protein [Marivirga harenae]|uniref:N-acetylneuraminate synthase family protein n=1 Tax=Marivirga harenae TaxID=2010992 RepID=UPI0026E0685D|nr:N-acetylneuraminate synthase family protein [Marivirga harenae]WKV10962.1 N-acetylneuraminate synthase family protein [Marivirga harenae]|tara:strand:- start:19738 stop:20754 length:1017 start_codon:yes stop_codon:yes gene_type:complete